VPMALVQLSCSVLAAGCFVGLCRPWREREPMATPAGPAASSDPAAP
jgi:DHA1 family bicyclomycin/chloramphenicol resistance-like MFS transporter